jgi:hypothetical protein
MKCDKELVIHWLNNQLPENERKAFEQHLSECPRCQHELMWAQKAFALMEEITVPEPSSNMQARFEGMLDTYKQSVEEKDNAWNIWLNNIYQSFTMRPAFQLAYSVILLAIGFGVAYLLLNRNSNDNSKQQLASLTTQVEEMKHMMMLSLLENPSASKRIQAVSYTDEISTANAQVIKALLTTLNEDPNVNVRLATLEALIKYSDDAAVREGLVQSIVQQESPLVQSALADVMLKLQEKKAVGSFKALLQKTGPGNPVRSKIQETINKLSI